MERRRTAWGLLLTMTAGCASHGAVHNAPDESRPHVTWEIRTGSDIGSEQFVCGSVRPGDDCVLQASTPERDTFTTVRLHLHAAAQRTNYLGILAVPFVRGAERRSEREVSATVTPGARPLAVTVSGLVTSKADAYTLRVRLDATQADSTQPTLIAEDIAVTVK